MSTTIICPNCQHEFVPEDAIQDAMKKQLRAEMAEWQKKKEEEAKRLMAEKVSQAEQELRRKLVNENEVQLKALEQDNAEKDAKLKLAQQKELEFLKKEQAIISKEKELELQLQKMLLEERSKLTEQIRLEEEKRNKLKDEEYMLKMKELEKQLEDQRRLAEEMQRKAEQGSMQLQGEVQELALEELLRHTFPFDIVAEVGKGVKGADCIQTVRNNFGQECGKIIYESKRTKDFSNEWIEKLKADMLSQGAEVAVIVTQAMPKDMDHFGEKNGVWICSFSEVKALTTVLRDLIIRVFKESKSRENTGDKMTMLYNYLTSHEFSGQWKAIQEGFMYIKTSIQKEREQMEKLWKVREKQMEKVLLNAAHIKGSIEGIAGMEHVDLNLVSDDTNHLLE